MGTWPFVCHSFKEQLVSVSTPTPFESVPDMAGNEEYPHNAMCGAGNSVNIVLPALRFKDHRGVSRSDGYNES